MKGLTILSCLPCFDIIDGCVPDYMHSVLPGVSRSITTLWFNSKNLNHHGHWDQVPWTWSQCPWYLGPRRARWTNNFTFNVRLCLHLPNTVRNWGPLWSQSAFVFECYNEIIFNMIKSSQSVSQQIIKTVWLQIVLPSFAKDTMLAASHECLTLLPFKWEKMNAVHCSLTSLDRPKIRMIKNDDFFGLE